MAHRIWQVVGLLAAAAVLVLVVLYIARPAGKHRPAPAAEAHDVQTVAAATVYAPVTPLPALTPTPSPPQLPPQILDVATGTFTPLVLPPDYSVQSVFADGHIYAETPRAGAIFDTSGHLLATLPALFGAQLVSRDRRYMAYMRDGALQVSDSSGTITSTLPPDAEFDTEFGDGWLLLPGNNSLTASGAAIVDPRGRTLHQFSEGVRLGVDSISPDRQRIAWAAANGLHVFSVAGQEERVYPDVRYVVGTFAWSPATNRIAYARVAGNNTVQVWVLSLGDAQQHQVFMTQAGQAILDLAFLDAHRLSFRIRPADGQGGDDRFVQRYLISDEGAGLGPFDTPADRWYRCGTSCGMPPDGYEDADGVAQACVPAASVGTCAIQISYVDRVRQRVIPLVDAASPVDVAISSDRTIAAALEATGTLTLHLVTLTDGAIRPVALPEDSPNFSRAAWLDGHAHLLLYAAGGN
jgi:hypothetical protein